MASILTRLKVDQISEEVTPTALRPDAAWIESLELGVEVRFEPPPVVDLEIHRVRDQVFVSGRIAGRTLLACSRCLEPAKVFFDEHFQAVYLPVSGSYADPRGTLTREIGPGDPCEVADEDINNQSEDIFHHVRGWLDFTPMLREQLLLAIPDRALCDQECRGLCPTCGGNLNLAACDCPEQNGILRLEKLRSLRIR
ncbi:MAG: hypothetical protein A2Y95_05970 [Deltaproteobacteria bacterium RBG_13_65_10]|nr:MAG: hypothetical protein A2Y95_05970 [Deltaproteobacteria bacterium RBG_13_65_10]